MDRILWINKGSTKRMLGRIIKPNEKFLAHAEDIPIALRNVIRPVDPVMSHSMAHSQPMEPLPVLVPTTGTSPMLVPVEEKPPDVPATVEEELVDRTKPRRHAFRRTIETSRANISIGYALRERFPGQFDIIDSEGKVVNEQTLTETEARNFIKILE